MSDEFIRQAEHKLQELDPILGAVIAAQKLTPRQRRTDFFASLCRSIIGQQVSVAAAAAINARFESVTNMRPERVAGLNDDEIKQIGLSRQKVSYLKDLAGHFIANPDVYAHLDRQTDEQVITELTAVKGIGVWTAQMFLMFTLARPDIFAPDDVGLQNAMIKIYNWETLPPKKELVAFAERWKPYRSVASLHLWESLNNKPAE